MQVFDYEKQCSVPQRINLVDVLETVIFGELFVCCRFGYQLWTQATSHLDMSTK